MKRLFSSGSRAADRSRARDHAHGQRSDLISVGSIPGVYDVVEGLPQIQWDLVEERLSHISDHDDRDQARREALRQWLQRLGEALGPNFKLWESRNALILSASAPESARRMLRFTEHARAVLRRLLDKVSPFDPAVIEVVVEFDADENYYSYISHFYADGEYATSGGMCVKHGYPHVLLTARELDGWQPALAHELTHRHLTEADLPLWLEEGVCQMMEEIAAGAARFHFDREIQRRHHRHWRRRGLKEFWFGYSFHDPKSQELAYHLALVLVRILALDHKRRFPSFLADAHADDAGARAASEHLNLSLGALAAQVLGEGDWEPDPLDASTDSSNE